MSYVGSCDRGRRRDYDVFLWKVVIIESVRTLVATTRALLEREYGDRLAGVVLSGSHARGGSESPFLLNVRREGIAVTPDQAKLQDDDRGTGEGGVYAGTEDR